MFKLIGSLVLVYVAYCLHTGRVYAKDGPWGKTVTRADSPVEYWAVVTVYTLLSIALMLFL